MKDSQTDKLRQLEAIREAANCLGCLHEGLIVTDNDGVIVETNLATDRILESPSLKGSNILKLCSIGQSYDDMIRHIPVGCRNLNRPIIFQTQSGKRKLVNMSVQRVGEGDTVRLVHVFQDCAD